MSKVTFIVFEPSYIVRKGLVALINEQPNTIVARETDNIKSLTDAVNYHGADAIVVNAELLKTISQSDFKTLTSKKRVPSIIVVGNIVQNIDENFSNLVTETILINDNKLAVLKKIKRIVNLNESTEEQPDNSDLSDREREILKDVALGLSNKEIAQKNFISPHTVITHRKNITRKLGIKTVSGLTIYAILNKIIGMDALE